MLLVLLLTLAATRTLADPVLDAPAVYASNDILVAEGLVDVMLKSSNGSTTLTQLLQTQATLASTVTTLTATQARVTALENTVALLVSSLSLVSPPLASSIVNVAQLFSLVGTHSTSILKLVNAVSSSSPSSEDMLISSIGLQGQINSRANQTDMQVIVNTLSSTGSLDNMVNVPSLQNTQNTQSSSIGKLVNAVSTLSPGNENSLWGITALVNQINSSAAIIASQGTTLTSQGNAITALTTRVTTDENALTTLTTRVTNDETTITSHTSSIATLSVNATTLSTRLTTDETTIASHTSSIASLNTLTTGIQSSLTTLTSRVTTDEGTITSQGSSITTLTSRISSDEATITSQGSAITALTTRATTDEATITSQGNLITALTSRVTTDEATITSQGAAITALTSRVTTDEGTIAGHTTSINSLTTTTTAASGCGGSGLVYSGSGCVAAAPYIPAYSATACSAANTGLMRLNNSDIIYCNGAAWQPATGLGLTPRNPAASCAAIIAVGTYSGPGLYYITSGVNVLQMACVGTTNLGSTGTSTTAVASSCSSILSYFGRSEGYYYIDPSGTNPPSSGSAINVYCNSGVSYGGNGATSLSSSVSCTWLATLWGQPAGTYYINYATTYCFGRPITSCNDGYTINSAMTSGVYNVTYNGIDYPTYCYISGGYAWTLMMKINGGTSGNFGYDSAYWSNTKSLNPTTGVTGGIDAVEYKSPLFGLMPFTQMLLGMRSSALNWVQFPYTASSMYSIFAPNVQISTTITSRAGWFTLSGASALQVNCQAQGFNVQPVPGMRVRIGILGNQETDCLSCDSRIGIGGAGSSCSVGDQSVLSGYQCSCTCYNSAGSSTVGDAYGYDFSYVLVA